MMKKYIIKATFPEMQAAHACQALEVTASNMAVAAGRGLRSMLQSRHLRRKRIKTAHIRIETLR